MGKKFTYISTSEQDRVTWETVCPVGEFRVLPPSNIPPILASGLAAKTDSVLVVASGDPNGTALWMVNAHRVDARASAIDQEPLGIIFRGDTPALSGCLLHHGTWPGKSAPPPPEFWNAMAASGIGNCYPFSGLPSKTAGPISELNVPSQHGAFEALVMQLKDCLVSGG